MESSWSLHPQLAADTIPVGDLPLTRVLLNDDANYPWLILVPRKPSLVDLIDLSDDDQVRLLREVSSAARALKEITRYDKLNVAALGNQVPQLHGISSPASAAMRHGLIRSGAERRAKLTLRRPARVFCKRCGASLKSMRQFDPSLNTIDCRVWRGRRPGNEGSCGNGKRACDSRHSTTKAQTG